MAGIAQSRALQHPPRVALSRPALPCRDWRPPSPLLERSQVPARMLDFSKGRFDLSFLTGTGAESPRLLYVPGPDEAPSPVRLGTDPRLPQPRVFRFTTSPARWNQTESAGLFPHKRR